MKLKKGYSLFILGLIVVPTLFARVGQEVPPVFKLEQTPIDKSRSDLLIIPYQTPGLNGRVYKPETAAGAFFKPVGIGLLSGLLVGASFGFIQKPTEDLGRKEYAIIYGSLLGLLGTGVGVTIGLAKLIGFRVSRTIV